MFNLENQIAAWRRQMISGGVTHPDLLDELEGHLREEVGTLLSSGLSDVEAFKLAVSHLGNSSLMRTEFSKVKCRPWFPLIIVSCLGIGAVVFLAVMALHDLFAGRGALLLAAHVYTLTAGYFAGLLAGTLGICYICSHLFGNVSPARQHSASRAVFWFNCLSSGFVAGGVLLGMLWSRQNLGTYVALDPRQIATWCVLAWFIASLAVQRFCRIGLRFTMLMCLVGNIVILMGWFGANLFETLHGYGIGSYWPLPPVLGLHLFFLLLGLVPAGFLRARTHDEVTI